MLCWDESVTAREERGAIGRALSFLRAHPDGASAAANAAAVVVLAGVGLVGYWREAPWVPDVPLVVRLLPALLGCIVILVKRRAPFTALGIGVALALVDGWLGGSLGMIVVLFDLLYSAVLWGPVPAVRRLLIAIVVIVAASIVVPLALGLELPLAVLAGIQAFVVLGTPYWWATSVRRGHVLAELAEARARDAERFAALARDDAVREERARMARDLHDVVAGNLSAIAITAEGALAGPRSGDRDRAALRAVREASVAGLEEMRSMIVVLRSGDAAAEDLVAPVRLTELDGLVAAASDLQVVVEGEVPVLPTVIDQAFARVVAESLANAARHAPRAHVVVAFLDDGGSPGVDITSTGGIPTSAPSTGLGIALMRERAERLGGELHAGAIANGWRVRLRIPAGAP